MSDMSPGSGPPPARQPVFNLPAVVSAIIAAIIAVHALSDFVLGQTGVVQLLLRFAFIPIRELSPELVEGLLPTGGERLWTFVTYAFLHADWPHVLFNCLWIAAFGSPLAWRLGTSRFLLFSAAGAIAGAALHLALYPDSAAPLVGASAAISAHMAGAARFVFARGGADVAARRSSRLPAAGSLPRRGARQSPRLGIPRRVVRAQPHLRVDIRRWCDRLRCDRLGGPYRRFSGRAAAVSGVRPGRQSR